MILLAVNVVRRWSATIRTFLIDVLPPPPPPYSSILYENPAHNFNGSFILFFHRLLLLLFGDLRSAVLLLFERACVYVCLCVSVCVRVRACVCVCVHCLALH